MPREEQRKRQKCETCKNYAGDCPWTAVGKDGRVKFEPIPGWTAERVQWSTGRRAKWTYAISDCPLYVDDSSGDRQVLCEGEGRKPSHRVDRDKLLQMIKQGASCAEIEFAFNISTRAVAYHRQKLQEAGLL